MREGNASLDLNPIYIMLKFANYGALNRLIQAIHITRVKKEDRNTQKNQYLFFIMSPMIQVFQKFFKSLLINSALHAIIYDAERRVVHHTTLD